MFISIGGGVAVLAGAVATALAPGASAGLDTPVDSVVTTTDDYDFAGPDGVCNAGPGGTCSLREAVVEADQAGGTVTFGVDGTFGLAGSIPAVQGGDVEIIGNGVGKTIIEHEPAVQNFRGGPGEGSGRHFTVEGSSLDISGMTLQGGDEKAGGSIWVHNGGELRTEDVHFLDNSAAIGGAIYAAANDDTVIILDTTFAGNGADRGGAIYAGDDTVSIQNATFTDNVARSGAAIFAASSSIVDIHWSTFSQNVHGTPFFLTFRPTRREESPGGTVHTLDGADVTISHSILEKLAGNSADECTGEQPLVSAGANIVDDESCEFSEPLDSEGTPANVGPLQDNGGATFTMALAADSAAVDVDPALCKLNDQRDLPRNVDGDDDGTEACDSGAYELQAAPEETTTSTSTTAPDGDVDADTATPATPTVARPNFTG